MVPDFTSDRRFSAARESDKTIADRTLQWAVIDNDKRREGQSYHEFVMVSFPVRPLNGKPEDYPDVEWYHEADAEFLARTQAGEWNREVEQS